MEVGFQGVDPSTDFRGTGTLGYENLVYFVKEHFESAKRILRVARDKKTEFFFACAAINVTFFLKKLLKENKSISEFLGGARTIESVKRRFNELFCSVFEEFAGVWEKDPRCGSFMNFNTVLVE